jgi:hypothetical protein
VGSLGATPTVVDAHPFDRGADLPASLGLFMSWCRPYAPVVDHVGVQVL